MYANSVDRVSDEKFSFTYLLIFAINSVCELVLPWITIGGGFSFFFVGSSCLGSSFSKSITCSDSSSLRTANLFFSVMLDVWVLFIFLVSLSIGVPFLLFLLLLVGLVY